METIAAFDYLIYFFEHIDVLMLVFIRSLGFFMALPIISGQGTLMQGRIFLALCMAAALFVSGQVTTVYLLDTTPGYVYLVLLEFLVGMTMGYVVLAVFSLLFFSGQLMDFKVGFMMVNVIDPMTQVQVPLTGNLFYMGAMAMLVVTGGLHAFIMTFFYSYQILPIGTAVVIGNQQLAWYIVMLLVESTILAVRLAMPIVASMFIITVALGIMVKTIPQLNVFVVGIPLRLLVGLIILWLVMIPNMGAIFGHVFDIAIIAIREVIWGMQAT